MCSVRMLASCVLLTIVTDACSPPDCPSLGDKCVSKSEGSSTLVNASVNCSGGGITVNPNLAPPTSCGSPTDYKSLTPAVCTTPPTQEGFQPDTTKVNCIAEGLCMVSAVNEEAWETCEGECAADSTPAIRTPRSTCLLLCGAALALRISSFHT